MKNELLRMVEKRQMGIHCGIPSFCSANKIVIETVIEQAQRYDDFVVIEATSNQVNQYGGYMGMTSVDFKNYVYEIADKINFDKSKIILGGDHLGPLPWANLPAKEAMEKAKVLVRDCVKAGYLKIHLDTSMRLGDDDTTKRLSDDIIAARGAVLYRECMAAYNELLAVNPDAVKPVFVIGSEVPVPGGTVMEGDIEVTHVDDLENTLFAYRKAFQNQGMTNAFKDIIAIVVQPGVEFGEYGIHPYDRFAARGLCNKLKQYPDIVFEGHSTDYQPYEKLREMVEDGIAIIKVGPALTYAVREALFALSMIEDELIEDTSKKSNLRDVLEKQMLEDDSNWAKYYHGSDLEKKLMRKYSFSDRCRYYFANDAVEEAIEKLFANLDSIDIPNYILHQYMPLQYVHVRDGKIKCKAKELVKDAVRIIVEDYNYAVKMNYMMETVNM